MKKLLLLLVLFSFSATGQCPPPYDGNASNIQNDIFDITWIPAGAETAWEVMAQYAHFPMPGATTPGALTTTPFYTFSNLPCGSYRFFVRAICNGSPGAWGELDFSVGICAGGPPPVELCEDWIEGTADLNLSVYNDYFLSNLPQASYLISYYLSEADAQNQTNALEPVIEVDTQEIYVRFNNVNLPYNHYIRQYSVIVHMRPEIPETLIAEGCHNGDGNAVFNLNYITNQIFASHPEAQNWTLSYHEDELEAQFGNNPIQNTGAYSPPSFASQGVLIRIVDNITGCWGMKWVGFDSSLCAGFEVSAFFDVDGDGTKDANEVNFPQGTFSYTVNGGAPVNSQSASGTLEIADDNVSNQYQISFIPENPAVYSVSPTNVVINAGPSLQEIFFAVTAINPTTDLAAFLVPANNPQPGFSYYNKVIYKNMGTMSHNGVVTFTKDPTVSIVQMPPGAVVNTSGFTLNFSNLMPFETREFMVKMQVPVIPTVQLGDLLTNQVSITLLPGDILPMNNQAILTQTIIGSYDPNDKVEAHGGPIVLEQFSPDEELVYTIRFENTGTAAASFITVEDELDAQLDAVTLRMISASHDYVLTKNGQSLSWFFDDVNLPPTSQDPIGSHGYITFAVKPNAGLQVGDIIPNTASIFFDFNPAIVTNTFETEFMAPLSTPGYNSAAFTMHPNPASAMVQIQASGIVKQIMVSDLTGKNIFEIQPSEQNPVMDVSKLHSGMYLMQVILENGNRSVQKLIKN